MSKLMFNLEDVTPVYKTFPGWKTSITGIANFADLPENAQSYVNFIANFIGAPIKIISTGPGREDIIKC